MGAIDSSNLRRGRRLSQRLWASILVTAASLAVASCTAREPTEPSPEPREPQVHSVALAVETASDLPTCTPSLAGTTAFVESPPGLWSCVNGGWWSIPCSPIGGDVAYASA